MTVFKKKTSKKLLGYLCCLVALLLCACAEVKEYCGDYVSMDGCYALTVRSDPWDGGTVSPTNQQNITDGMSVNISAVANDGYVFVDWYTLGGAATFGNVGSANTTVTLSSNATIWAYFWRLPTLTVNASPRDGGTVSPTSQENIIPGTPVNITASANEDYIFVNWTATSGTATFGNRDSANTTVTLSSNATIRANFQRLLTLTVYANPMGGGTVSPTSQENIIPGTPVNITASANEDYIFVNWTATSGTATFGNRDSANTTVTLSSDATIRANFYQPPKYTLTINSNPAIGGTFTPASGLSNDSGTVISISAVANEGYSFVNWTATSGTATFGNRDSANTTVTLRSDATIRANFQQGQFGGVLTYRGRDYRTVIIGGKRWMAENLNYDTANGSGSWCYLNDSFYCGIYGRLYDWVTAMALPANCTSISCATMVRANHQGICPDGWLVPTNQDWNDLVSAVGSPAGTKLKSTLGWDSGGNGTDDFGFSALPGGNRGYDWWSAAGSSGYWWSATEYGSGSAYYRGMMGYDGGDGVGENWWDSKDRGFSVRCVAVD